MRILTTAVFMTVLCPVAHGHAQYSDEPTRVVVLGVGHSTQLVEERQRPAALRAFFDRVSPDAIGVERSPEAFARGDHYEFTYEIQYVAVPYARGAGVPLHPFDWIPPAEDMLLGFGVDLEAPPFLRSGWRGFLSFPDSAEVGGPLLFADEEEEVSARLSPWREEWEPASRDLPRRLFLYRTFLQAQRIAAAAREYPGGTLLVIVGVNHKGDIERILADDPMIRIVQPSHYGAPSGDEIEAAIRDEDLWAIATFNLLGVQASTGNVDLDWMRRVVGRLEESGTTPETRLLATRLGVLTGEISLHDALDRYRQIIADVDGSAHFNWTGVKDPSRVDSYFDPFGNLTISQRAAVEIARLHYWMGRDSEGDEIRDQLIAALPEIKGLQLSGYWSVHLRDAAVVSPRR